MIETNGRRRSRLQILPRGEGAPAIADDAGRRLPLQTDVFHRLKLELVSIAGGGATALVGMVRADTAVAWVGIACTVYGLILATLRERRCRREEPLLGRIRELEEQLKAKILRDRP